MIRDLALFGILVSLAASTQAAEPPLQQQLRSEPPATLVKAVREQGDASRGAVLFFQGFLGCAKCHDSEAGTLLGPDLAASGKEATAEYLLESILEPSKVIKKGYEPVRITTIDGRTTIGFVVEEKGNQLIVLDPSGGGSRQTIAKADIDTREASKQSLMPDGLINALSDRQQFLDLAKYVFEVVEGGPTRARQLRPATTALVLPPYEAEIDHAGLIRSWDAKSLARGEAIYNRVCANCHGTMTQAGSLPTSPRFAGHTFKNGHDPYSLYQTITRGYGLMAAQTWMVPRQKYDVIHYIRETYLKDANPKQYAPVNDSYLAKLPKGRQGEFGPAPANVEPWVAMDYGPSLMNTYEVGGPGPNIAYKGIAVRLDPGAGGVARGKRWALFDHDTMRLAALWSGDGFIDWRGIHFNGQHQIHPKLIGDLQLANPVGPGWANPETGSFDDPRLVGRDGRKYGPLPRPWARFKGTYAYGDQTILSYTVGKADILETYGSETDPTQPQSAIFTRTLDVGPTPHDLLLRVAPQSTAVALVGTPPANVSMTEQDGEYRLRIKASDQPTRIKLLFSKTNAKGVRTLARSSPPAKALKPFLAGGPRRWPETLRTELIPGKEDGPFAVDTLTLPNRNPWNAQLRLTGFDFMPDGKRMAVCTWDGDVWMVSGLDDPTKGYSWQRIAGGLFQPLGLKLRDGAIYVSCRDQIVRLHDLNGDGETDFYETFNSDHQVTEHFHEFAMGLQTDEAGNFYYAKSGRHALPALVPHHGTLLKVSADGSKTEILATGFRAANGVCLNPDGSFFITDQEGFWTPKNRINRVTPGGFYGNLWGYTDITDKSDTAMEQALCWITNDFDRSPAELVWVTSPKWGPLKGSLLNLSYGHGKIYVVPHETVDGKWQGGMCALPIPTFPTGVMRGRFHSGDGALYACGMFAWAGNQTQPGGFYRVRPTGKPMDLPIQLKAKTKTIEITLTDLLDPKSVSEVGNYTVKVWGLKRSQNYGSKHIDEHPLSVTEATLAPDGKTVRLTIPDLAPTWGMSIEYRLQGKDGRPVRGLIHNTIHTLAKE